MLGPGALPTVKKTEASCGNGGGDGGGGGGGGGGVDDGDGGVGIVVVAEDQAAAAGGCELSADSKLARPGNGGSSCGAAAAAMASGAAQDGEALIWMLWPCLPTADITAAEQERERAVGEGTKGVEMRLSFDTAKPHGIAAPAGLMSLASGKSAFGPAIHRTHRVCRARAWRDVFCPQPSLLCSC